MTWIRHLWAAWLVLAMMPALAHKPSDSYLTMTIRDAGLVDLNWHVALRDLDGELLLDANDDGRLTWGEVRRRWHDMAAYVRPHLQVRHAASPCEPVEGSGMPPAVIAHSDGQYMVLGWTVQCPAQADRAWESLELDYRLFALSDPTHRGIVRWQTQWRNQPQPHHVGSIVLGAQQARHDLTWDEPETAKAWPPSPERAQGADGVSAAPTARPSAASSPSVLTQISRFAHEGVVHIASGLDHLLFLTSLLLVSVWHREGRTWQRQPMAGWKARSDWRSALAEVCRLVTAFTLAHSLTLALATFGVLAPPSRWVESLIATSVLVAALDNLWPILHGPRWLVVFGFGLVHGFGFAGAMQDLGLSQQNLAWPLLGFNLGVELGQLALVAVVLPLACLVRQTRSYRQGLVLPGSLAIAVMSALWLYERAADVSLGWLPG